MFIENKINLKKKKKKKKKKKREHERPLKFLQHPHKMGGYFGIQRKLGIKLLFKK